MRSAQRLLAVLLSAALLTPVMPAYSLQSIRSVSFADASTGYMGGALTSPSDASGFVSVTSDGGASWFAQPLPGMNSIVSVTAGNAQNAFAAAQFNPRPFKTSNWGATWGPTSAAVPGSELELSAVERLANGRMAAVGKYIPTAGGHAGLIALSENLGASWTKRFEGPLYPATEDADAMASNADMRDVDTHGAGTVAWAVGNERNPGTGGDTATFKQILIYKTTNGGLNWTKQTSAASATGLSMSSVVAVSDTVAFIAGNYWTVLKTTNGGSTWAPATNPAGAMGAGTPGPTKGFNDIAAWDANTVVAVGDDGRVARSTNGGSSWTGYQTPQKKKLRSVALLSATKWIVVGDDETIYQTTNGGTSWTVRSAGIGNPLVTVTSPAVQLLTAGQKSITGSVSDVGVGVATMQASIKRKDGKYAQDVNGSSWGVTEEWFSVTVQSNQTWDFSWTPDSATVSGGEAWVKVRANDGLGNSSFQTVAYQPDTEVPVITVGGVVEGATYGGAVTPVFSATDNVGVVSPGPTATLNGVAFTSGTPVSANGAYTLVVRASDAAGNDREETVHFTIDSNVPVITVTQVEHNKHYSTDRSPTFEEPTHASGIQTWGATLDTLPFTSGTAVSAEGPHSLVITATSNAGPTATTQIDFVIDKTAPEIALSGVTHGDVYKNPVTPVITSSDTNLVEPVEATLNGVSFVSGTTIGTDGLYTLEVIAEDKAGNETKRTAAFRMDTTVPSVVDTKLVYKHNRTEVTLAATDVGSGVQRIGYRVNSGTEQFVNAASGVANVDGFGTRKLEYRAHDKAGNVSDWAELTVHVKQNTGLAFSAPTTSDYASAKVSGTLKTSSGTALGGKTVRIEYYSGGWKLTGTAKTLSNGAFSYTTKPTIKTTYRAVYEGDATQYLRVESASRAVEPKASLSKPWSSKKTVKAKKTYTWYSSIKPRHTSGSKVVKLEFQRYKSGKYRAYKTIYAKTYNYSSYSRVKASYKLPYKGKWRVRAVHDDAGHAKTYSSWLYKTAK